ncbi:MAG: hypothetical protein HYZ92_00765 [Candidatus Omnitrophica bacterium]|nr:hypothetical protein [Candidatus Omnitrophota bacterium]
MTGCEGLQKPPQARFPEDLGPDALTYEQLQRYPSEQQANYVVFAKRCSKCHTPARPLNSAYASPQMWSRYVTKMWRKTGSGISHEDAKRLLAFLTYDSQVRKLDHREEFQAHRRQLFEQFKAQDPQAFAKLYGKDADSAIRLR